MCGSTAGSVVRHCKVVRAGPHGRTPPDIPYIGTMWGQYISLPAACVAPRYQTQLTVPKT